MNAPLGPAAPFLQQVAFALLEKHGTQLRDVAVVLPSQRAGLYLRKWLAEVAGKALWSPQVFTIGSFLEGLSGLRPLAAEELLFEGYEAYRATEGARAQPFGDFLQWGATMLADISEADAHLLPLQSYYRNLDSWEKIEWTFKEKPLSQGQQRMLRYWAMVGQVHGSLDQRLLAQGSGTTGLIEKTAAEVEQLAGQPWQAVWFAGLNALTPAQEKVLKRFHQEGLARFAWDGDHYYFDRTEQESGSHLRKAVELFGPGKVPMGRGLEEGNLKLRTIRVAHGVAQAWCAAELLRQSTEAERERTAVVLADEGLFQPLLEALPADLGPVNITMGLPVLELPVGSFIEALHRLHAGAKPGAGFFHADVARFLGHPFLRQGGQAGKAAQLLAALATTARIYLPGAFLRTAAAKVGLGAEQAMLFTEVEDVRREMPAITASALSWAKDAVAKDDLSVEQIFQVSLILGRIQTLLERYAHELDIKAYATLFRRLLGTARIGLFGEPLAGVQVMGLLEARALDPQRVIVLGAREGVLPASRGERSFIPFELRREFRMPLPDGHDAVQGYNFLRILQRAREAVLVWPEGEDTSGPSRFILQLEHELFKNRPERLQVLDLHIPMREPPAVQVMVHKDEAAIAAMRNKLKKGLSPSALGCWLRCPLDFHFRYVLGMKEAEETDVRIPSNLLGEALHHAVEQVYRPWLGKPLQIASLEEARGYIESLIREDLGRKVPVERLQQGQPLLQMRMAVHAAQRFLRKEMDLVRTGTVVTPIALEEAVEYPLEMAAARIGSPVLFTGRLDRVDRKDSLVRILDMKTGRVDPRDLKIKEFSLEAIQGPKGYAVQLMVYAWLYLMQHPETDAVQAGILPLQRGASNEPLLLELPGGDTVSREDLPAIGQLLAEAVQAMMDPALPVQHNKDSAYCKFCLDSSSPN
jgi:hypothetical protein